LRRYHILPAHRIKGTWDKLAERAAEINVDDAMFRLNDYKAKYLYQLLILKENPNHKFKKVQAWEHHLLMLVSCVHVLGVYCHVQGVDWVCADPLPSLTVNVMAGFVVSAQRLCQGRSGVHQQDHGGERSEQAPSERPQSLHPVCPEPLHGLVQPSQAAFAQE
jgi:hypothetical protein